MPLWSVYRVEKCGTHAREAVPLGRVRAANIVDAERRAHMKFRVPEPTSADARALSVRLWSTDRMSLGKLAR